jgi:diguanylate cyclase (GGDEF)-like protein
MINLRREATIYALALAFLAVLSLASYLIIDSIVSRQQHMASVLSVSGRQPMLSQRIAMLGLQLSDSKSVQDRDNTVTQLREAVDLMRRSHRDLTEGSLALGIDPPKNRDLRAIYFSPPNDLNRKVTDFLAAADKVLVSIEQNAPSQTVHASAQVVVLANTSLLDSLAAAVSQYAADSEALFRQSQIRVLFVTAAMLIALTTEALFVFRPLYFRIRTLVDMAQSDPLTGCFNRRSLLESAARDFSRTRRAGSPLSVILLDIDHFKLINDTYGHAAGDAVIRTLTEVVKNAIRTADLLGRMGGEEFVVFLPDTDTISALLVAEKLRCLLEQSVVKFEQHTIAFTASFGVAQMSEQDDDPLALIERADTQMYQAKHDGRNCVRSAIVG